VDPGKKVLVSTIAGAVFIMLLGSALHFTYELSGRFAVVGVFSAVNESVWEHLKLAFWPALVWLLIEYLPLRNVTNNFLSSKTVGVCIMVAFIPAVFYLYTSFTHQSVFVVDITTFVVAIVVGQVVSFFLFKKDSFSRNLEKIAFAVLLILAVVFVVFTFYPLHLPIFQDPVSSNYGIAA
jgi:hypothetical protein